MRQLSICKLIIVLIAFSAITVSCNNQISRNVSGRRAEKQMSGRSRSNNYRESRGVRRAKKKQEKNEREIKRDYAKSVDRSRRRTLEIQTPEVRERMKQNQSNIALRDKARSKKVRSTTKKAGKKYK